MNSLKMTSMNASSADRRPSKGVQQNEAAPNGEYRPRLSSRHPSIDPDRLVRMDRYNNADALELKTTVAEDVICRVRPIGVDQIISMSYSLVLVT